MTAVVVPKINSNDARYLLVEWVAKDGSTVRPGDVLALIETSKTIEELESEYAGVLRHVVEQGAECEPGQTIARLGGPAPEPAPPPPPTSGPVITAPARALMDELGVTEDQVRALNHPVIRRTDVTAAFTGETDLILPPPQRRIADVVTRAHRETPAAYTVVKIDVEEALRLARELTPRLRTLIGLPELLVRAVAGLTARFEPMFATPIAPGRLRRAPTAHVGVTMDVGKGLYVPVVRDATNRSLEEISRTLMAHRMTAMRGGFREEDLSGANIAVTLHNQGTVTLAIPIVFPGQVCALALAAPQREVVPDGDGFAVRRTVHLGLAYDHRYVNGHDAVLFLDAIRTALETPGDLA
ncbi:2-oxoglutarate dehydrogenase E2 component (dihydrolipoamide succinyltransferase) [Nonomuraea solani]|uniref:Dihydrolipoamide acetyltransferase component of pyruvate dehydrogenase complex n=1 Tax=Nonomuraea solani TaxID=1144553 RepID=A0A1H6ESB7_9ACTN|nr:2-oxo acid dehydrogenase subunit E2 [Nonomuraea solani]SEH00750.1 2-oxoglutarate dehydrogenase E2 component (dihydrolipoamide succinyltransferase) [Nonomuraea solani]